MDRDDRLLAYVQNRLAGRERESFEADMASDSTLAAEVAVMQAARTAMASEETTEARAAGWRRLQGSLEHARPETANRDSRPGFYLAQAAVVAIAAVALWQFAVMPLLAPRSDDAYLPASQEIALPVLQVVFAEEAEIGQIAGILREHRGTIVDGPGALGVYRITFPDPQRRASAAKALSGQPGLVNTVIEE